MIKATEHEGVVELSGLSHFRIEQIFDCGQCFRFDPSELGGIEGVAFGKHVRFTQSAPNRLTIHGASTEDYETLWKGYLSLDRDYGEIQADILERFGNDRTIREAMSAGDGIRILRQDPWEAVCSFIISQNNNIPRIKKLIASLCMTFGRQFESEGGVYWSFPDAATLAAAGTDAIFALKTGFRAKYITDAAERFASGALTPQMIEQASFEDAMKLLTSIKGVGPKVASCALLFGFGRTDAFPVDVWIKRVLDKYYPDGLDINSLGAYAGIAQQYLFYYERYKNS